MTDILLKILAVGVEPDDVQFVALQAIANQCPLAGYTGSGHYSWHVINQPDEPGLACDFRQHSFELPFTNFRAIPYFPNYRLGVTPTYPCDSTIAIVLTSSLLPEVKAADFEVLLYPNPVKRGGVLEMELGKGVDGEPLLYDVLGREVSSQSVKGERQLRVALERGMDAGGYFWFLRNEAGEVASGKVVVVE
ncbi:MAG: hypothetical protein ACJATF_002698 [Flavobacteriales bacterium]